MRHGKIKVEGDLTLDTGASINKISTDGTLAGNSDTTIPTEKATKTYADTKESSLGFTPEDVANKDTDNTLSANSDVKYPSQKAIKAYVDSLALGIDWQESVLDRIDFTTAEPVSPSTGDRYINTVTGTSNQTSQSVTINGIYEWNGSTWTEVLPDEGFATWVEDEDILYVYNGTSWVKFGSTITHANLNALQGGQTAEFFHLTSAEHSELVNWLDNVTLASNGDLTLANGTNINEFSIDDTLSGDSDNAVPTEQAVKAYVDNEIAGVGGGAWSLISTTSVTSVGNSGDISIEPNKEYYVTVRIINASTGNSQVRVRFNSDTTATAYAWYVDEVTISTSPTSALAGDDSDSFIQITKTGLDTSSGDFLGSFYIKTYASGVGSAFVGGQGWTDPQAVVLIRPVQFQGHMIKAITVADFEVFLSAGTAANIDIRTYELAQS